MARYELSLVALLALALPWVRGTDDASLRATTDGTFSPAIAVQVGCEAGGLAVVAITVDAGPPQSYLIGDSPRAGARTVARVYHLPAGHPEVVVSVETVPDCGRCLTRLVDQATGRVMDQEVSAEAVLLSAIIPRWGRGVTDPESGPAPQPARRDRDQDQNPWELLYRLIVEGNGQTS